MQTLIVLQKDFYGSMAALAEMVASVAVGVANADSIIDQLIEEANKFVLDDTGTIISKPAFDLIKDTADEVENMGAKVLVDGRTQAPLSYENGYWLGPQF